MRSKYILLILLLVLSQSVQAQKEKHIHAVADADRLWDKDIQQSINLYLQETEVNPGNHYALNQLAHAYRSIKEYQKSIQVFKKLLDNTVYQAEVSYFLADNHFQLKEFDQGLSYLEKQTNIGFHDLYNSGFHHLSELRSSDYYEELILNQRFRKLIERVAECPFKSSVQYSSWSPDGNKLVVQAALRGSGSYDLYIYNFEAFTLRRLTFTRENEMAPKWSPDGAWIAFHRAGVYGGFREIYLIRPDGSEEKQLSTQEKLPGNKAYPAWFPDGKHLLFVKEGHDANQIYKVDTAGKEYISLTTAKGNKSNPTVNSNNELLYDIQLNDSSYSIASVDLTNGVEKRLTSKHWWWTPTWINDDKQVLCGFYAHGSVKLNRLAIMNADGSEKRILTAYGTDSWYPSVSPDGTRIAVASPVYPFFRGGSTLDIIDIETGDYNSIELSY